MSVLYLKSNTTRCQSNDVEINQNTITPIPPEIFSNYGTVIISMDIINATGFSFLITISQMVSFGTATSMISTSIDHMVISLITIIGKCTSRGFIILSIVIDEGFSSLEENHKFLELGIILRITSEGKHEPYTGRFNRSIKNGVV